MCLRLSVGLNCILPRAFTKNFVPDAEASQGCLGIEKLSEGVAGYGVKEIPGATTCNNRGGSKDFHAYNQLGGKVWMVLVAGVHSLVHWLQLCWW